MGGQHASKSIGIAEISIGTNLFSSTRSAQVIASVAIAPQFQSNHLVIRQNQFLQTLKIGTNTPQLP